MKDKKLKNQKEIKILATLGPSSMEKSVVQNMDASGVDIFRVNLSHTKVEDFENVVRKIQSWTKKPISIDTEGAQIRTGKMKNGSVTIKNNDIVNLTSAEILGDESTIPIYPITPHKILQLGDILAIDFNSAIVQVIKIENDKIYARVISEGKIGSNKAVNVDRLINLPPFGEKTLKALELAKKLGLNHIALSFAARKEDIEQLRKFFPYPIFVISKIESRLGLLNLEEICEASDALIIDRGDLSREVPLQKIALAQRHILDVARTKGIPVYVATNLLESMIDNFAPTRAEINDITSTLLAGAKGLVLAAETAVGKYPLKSVRMAFGIKKEVENWMTAGRQNYLRSIFDYSLIEPHGGVLVQNFINPNELPHLEKFPQVDVDDQLLSDIIQISEGTYSPLRGFMNLEELNSVLDDYKLPSGVIWTLPILFQLNKENINFGKKETIAIRRAEDREIYAIITVSNIEKIDIPNVAKRWFDTQDQEHPGVASFSKKGDFIVSGEVFLIKKPAFFLDSYNLAPKQSRQIFRDRGWQKIVGFHTRNVIHRGHEFIQKKALDQVCADGLFISPVIGQKKKNDFSASAILKSYEVMLNNNYYSPYPALMGTFNTYSRYSGPREAVFTALCRKNLGCSHFVVGRDHTGVGNYYPVDASQKLFQKLGNIGIVPLMFDAAYYCKICGEVTDHCSHGESERFKLSGTEVRKALLDGVEPPEYLIRRDIVEALKKMKENPNEKLFEG